MHYRTKICIILQIDSESNFDKIYTSKKKSIQQNRTRSEFHLIKQSVKKTTASNVGKTEYTALRSGMGQKCAPLSLQYTAGFSKQGNQTRKRKMVQIGKEEVKLLHKYNEIYICSHIQKLLKIHKHFLEVTYEFSGVAG